jgi:SAM-dependent methyltransferase
VKRTTSGGAEPAALVAGNAYDKYGSRNPFVRRLMGGFAADLDRLVARAAPTSIHEVGCGEGYWVLRWNRTGVPARGTDASDRVITLARETAGRQGLPPTLFEVRSIYDLDPTRDAADLVVCCEVLEHLEWPEAGLRALSRLGARHVVLSVPREPLWRVLNLARGAYLRDGGNTPGHLQHWSTGAFRRLVSAHFEVVEMRTPLPWTMLLCRPLR